MQRRAASTFSAIFVLVFFFVSAAPALLRAQTPPPIPANHVRIHYFRPDGNYLGWTVYAFGDTPKTSPTSTAAPCRYRARQFRRVLRRGRHFERPERRLSFTRATRKTRGLMNSSIPQRIGNEFWQLSAATCCTSTQPPTSSKPSHRFQPASTHPLPSPDNSYAN